MSLAEENRGLAFHIARRYFGDDEENLEGEALLGLVEAERRFDPSRGTFAALAGVIIRNRLGAAVARERERVPTVPLMLVGEDGEERERPEATVLPDPSAPLLDAQLRAAVTGLSEPLRTVVFRRFWRGSTLEEVGAELGLSRARVGQLEALALKRLRRALR